MRFNKIQLTGPSGTGKTTLAKLLSDDLNIPFISTSAKNVWPQFRIKKHSQVFDLSIPDFNDYQEAVNNSRVDALLGMNSYISDRAVGVDSIAYYFDYLSGKLSKTELDIFKHKVEIDMLTTTDAIIYLPYNFDKQNIIEDDGMRITNRYYQEKMTMMFDYVIGLLSDRQLTPHWRYTTLCEGQVHVLKLDSWDLAKKTRLSAKFIKNGPSWLDRNL